MKSILQLIAIVITSFVLLVFFIGCDLIKTEDKEDTSNPAKSISITDFNVRPDALSVFEVSEEINKETDFYDNEPDMCSAGDENSSTSCLDDIFDSYRFKKAGNGFYELNIPGIDMTLCLSTALTEYDFIESYAGTMDIYLKLQIALEDGSSANLDGKTFNEINTYATKISAIKLLQKMKSSSSLTMNYFGESVIGSTQSKYFMSEASNPDQPCIYTYSTITDCSTRSVGQNTTTIGSKTTKSTDLIILTKNNLNNSTSGTFYSGGTIDFIINNWDGTMIYNTNSKIAPTYTASNTSGSTIDGTYEGCNYSDYKRLKKRPVAIKQSIIRNLSSQLKSLRIQIPGYKEKDSF